MKAITAVAALSMLFTGHAVADAQTNHLKLYGIDIVDSSGTMGTAYEPTSRLVGVFDSSATYGSVFYDIDRESPKAMATQPAIGGSHDYGNVLYDVGAYY